MKKVIYLLASAALLLSACTKDEDPYLRVSAESLTFEGSASSKNVTIESNTAWEITGIKDWVSISKTSGKGDETLSVTVLENDGLDRECTINVSGSAISATIKVSQTGRPNLSVSVTELAFGCEASEKEVSLKSNKDWTVQSNSDWITVTPSSGKAAGSEQTVKIAVAANTESERAGELTFAINSEASVKVTVTQEGKSSINVSETELAFDSKASEKEVSLKSNKDWTVQSNSDWITVTPSSGKAAGSEQTVKIAVAANTDLERAGELTFAIDAETSVKVSVRQEGSVLEYAGVKYRTVKMKDGRTWMAENLRYVPKGITPSNDLKNVKAGVYYPIVMNSEKTAVEFSTSEDVIKSNGYLYQSEVALGLKVGDLTSVEQAKELEGVQGICPYGWHIPTVNEMVALVGKAVSPVETNENAPYYDKDKKNASMDLLNADGFNVDAWGAVSVQDNTKTVASLMGFLKNYPTGIASGYICGSSYADVTYNTDKDETSGVKKLQFFGFMPMKNNGTFNGSKLSYRIAASVRCIKNK